MPFQKKDYLFATIIGFSFALFSIPILQNLNFSFLQINIKFILLSVLFFVLLANLGIGISWLIGQKIPVIFQIAKFSAIGAFNTFLDWGILNALIYFTHIASGLGYASFKGFSFLIAVITSYFWNKYWAFESHEKANIKEFNNFILTSLVGALINISTAYMVVRFLTPLHLTSPERLANLGAATATLVSMVWNFVGYKFFVFKK